MANARFSVDYAKRASNCKRCKQPLPKEALRVAKVTPNPFSSDDDSDMKAYFHAKCLFESFQKSRAGTKVIETAADVESWATLKEEDKKDLLALIKELDDFREAKAKGGPKKASPKAKPKKDAGQKTLDSLVDTSPPKPAASLPKSPEGNPDSGIEDTPAEEKASEGEDNSLKAFCRLCRRMAKDSKYTRKTEILKDFIKDGSDGKGYKGDLYTLCKLLIPKADQRVYNLKEKNLIKLFATIFGTDAEEMTDHFNSCGEIADTVSEFFADPSSSRKPRSESRLSLGEVDAWLDGLTKKTKEEEQLAHLKHIVSRSTQDDLQFIIRFVKKDIRINAGAKHIMDALAPNAHDAFQASRNLRDVIDKVQKGQDSGPGKMSKALSVGCKLGVPVLPMLAEACKSVEFAMKRCPNGMYAEIKYDGERVQVHKHNDKYTYYSRSLKPVLPHKVQHFSTYIPEAFPQGGDLILDAEVLLIDTKTSKPLPFGTLGKHKKGAFSDANVCLFVFDCLMYQGQSLMDKPIKQRRLLLERSMVEIRNRVHFSDKEHIAHGDNAKLRAMIAKAIDEGLEGLVLKDVASMYEPGKRHWLKVKKDYLHDGAMADTADLIVLGGYFGTGNKGGIISVFLMGVKDKASGKYVTVTKVGNGHDDATLERINKELKGNLTKLGRDADLLPTWIRCSRGLAPDFVVSDPSQAPVWEITGAEFSKSSHHTADGISIRFPRVTKIRDDKDVQNATSLDELKKLYATSRETQNFTKIAKAGADEEDEDMEVRLPGLGPSSQSQPIEPHSPEAPTKRTKDDSPPSAKAEPESDEEAGPSPPKRPRAEPKPRADKAKEPCRYGADCYRKNAKHLKEFSHQEKKEKARKEEASPLTKARSATKTELPAKKEEKEVSDTSEDDDDADMIFAKLKVRLEKDGMDGGDKIGRYLAYYGATLCESAEEKADVVVTEKKVDRAGETQVGSAWVTDSVKKGTKLPFASYLL